ncbi:MAG: FAD:protein FMN transferase [Methylococcales bacterium]
MLKLQKFPFFAMGCPCAIQLYVESRAQGKRIAKIAMSDVYRLEARYSRYREDSVITQINQIAEKGGAIVVDEETASLLDYADACYRQSNGLFDITSGVLRKAWDFKSNRIPEQTEIENLLGRIGWGKVAWENPRLNFLEPGIELDFGGIGKEYAVDRAANLIQQQGLVHGLIDLGGDIRIIGPHSDGRPWSVGVRHPRMHDKTLASIKVNRGSVASSGDSERYMIIEGKRYSHIFSPITGWPVRGLASVSVISEQCVVSGSTCTIAILKEEKGAAWLEELGVSHLWVDHEGNMGGSQKDSS